CRSSTTTISCAATAAARSRSRRTWSSGGPPGSHARTGSSRSITRPRSSARVHSVPAPVTVVISMPDFLAQFPYWLAVALLVLGAMLRGQLMYWIGYAVTHQAIKGAQRRPAEAGRRGPIRRTIDWLDDGGAD